LIVDFGGVLTTSMVANRARFEAVESLADDSYRKALAEHPDGLHVYAELEVGRATQTDWNNTIGAILEIEPHDLMRRALAGLRPVPEMIRAVREARQAGIATAVLSNSFGLEPYDIYAEHGIYDLFDVVVLSELEGVRKPDPEIYRRVLDKLALTGEQCVFVDDHEDNLPPARMLGITTVLHTDPSTTLAELAALGIGAIPTTGSGLLDSPECS
jgi:putative hydrolase of the HAD superfamily